MKKPILGLLLLLCFCSLAEAQTITPVVVNATGSSYSNGYYQVDWSVGELALVNRMISANGRYIVTNGFLQPHNRDAYRPTNDPYFLDGEIVILPNPVVDNVEVDIKTKIEGKITMGLFDEHGRKLFSREFDYYGIGSIQSINMSKFAAGMYMLRLMLHPSQGFIAKKGAYKIIKIK